MIPKHLFFIWFGDNEPNYVRFSIRNFFNVNPDFDINFLRYTISEIENRKKVSKYDHIVYKCLDYIVNSRDCPYKSHIERNKKCGRKTIQILSNIVRYDLLNNYGGIYLDCDTFPIKPFDSYILSLRNFCSYTFHIGDYVHRRRDIMFIGSDKTKLLSEYTNFYNVLNVSSFNYQKNIEWNYSRRLFFDCELEYKKKESEFYIDHFYDRTWVIKNNKCRTPLCKYDN